MNLAREVGYCQGMAFVAGVLLTYFPEEDAFWMLVSLMKLPQYKLDGFFEPQLSRFQSSIWVLRHLIESHLPKLSLHLNQQVDYPSFLSFFFFLFDFFLKLSLGSIFFLNLLMNQMNSK